ncbi:hypothetical protein [Paenibacillus polysaccharolyticus]|uniref:hypothetical protein n=1 Tax=Paenibacillus polysaccharolyticus TaxID=582692 RepID=UPI00300980A0
MSFDIVGHLRIIDNATRPIISATRGMANFGAAAAKTALAVSGVGAAIAAIATVDKVLDKTIKAAAEFEMREVTVTAMFGKSAEKNVDKFMDYVGSRADVSQFSLDEFLDAGKSFIPTTKDNKQLEKMINLAERLGAIDPEQGIRGAAYALKELFSGDGLSLVERFELPRSAINEIKKLPIKDQLVQLDKYLNKIGATNELIDAQAGTAMGQWRTAVGGINRALRQMGTEALTSIKPVLADFNAWLKGPQFAALKAWGVDAFGGLVKGAVNAVRNATNYVQKNFINDPVFNRLPSFEQKVAFIFDSIGESFNKWWSAGGKDQTTKVTSDLIGFLIDTIEGSGKQLADIGVKVGKGIAMGIMQGIRDHLNVIDLLNPAKQQMEEFNRQYDSAEKLKEELDSWSKDNPGKPKVEGGSIGPSSSGGGGNALTNWWNETFSKSGWSGHSAGLDRVPYNGYPARLHQNEMVLTSQEARDYRESGNGKSSPTIMITGNTFNVRKDSDIEAIAGVLAARLAM